MGTTYPPDGWEVTTGTWGGSQMDQNTALNTIGDSCIEFLATVLGSDPAMTWSEFIPVEEGLPYRARCVARAATNTVDLTCRVIWYTSAEVFISYSYILNADTMAAADTWYIFEEIFTAPSTARFCKMQIKKEKIAEACYYDYVGIKEMPVCFWANQDLGAGPYQSIPDTTWTVVEYETEEHDYGGIYDNSANYRFTAPSTGIYAIAASIEIAAISSSDYVYLALFKNGSLLAEIDRHFYVTSLLPLLNGSVPAVYLTRGDYVDVRVYHNYGAGRNLSGDENCYFMAAKVE